MKLTRTVCISQFYCAVGAQVIQQCRKKCTIMLMEDSERSSCLERRCRSHNPALHLKILEAVLFKNKCPLPITPLLVFILLEVYSLTKSKCVLPQKIQTNKHHILKSIHTEYIQSVRIFVPMIKNKDALYVKARKTTTTQLANLVHNSISLGLGGKGRIRDGHSWPDIQLV